MTNELKLLKKENELRAACLSEQSQDALQKWREYAKFSDINPYDFELCYKELIGIASQKELDGSNLEEFFGENMQTVTEDILQSCPKKSLKDYFLFDFGNMIGMFAIGFVIVFFLSGRLWKDITLGSFLEQFVLIGVWFIYLRFVTGDKHRSGFFTPNLNQKIMRTFSVYFMFLTAAGIIVYGITKMLSFVSLHVPNAFLCVIYGVLWAMIMIWRNRYIKEMSSRKRWKD